MTGLLTASSPVEIEAEADEMGLDRQAREAALSLFHDLTGRLELASLDLTADGATGWPAHRFYFGRDGSDPAKILAALQERSDALRVTASPLAGTAVPPLPATLFVDGVSGAFAAVLVACTGQEALGALGEMLERR
jgi:hypothetical protein